MSDSLARSLIASRSEAQLHSPPCFGGPISSAASFSDPKWQEEQVSSCNVLCVSKMNQRQAQRHFRIEHEAQKTEGLWQRHFQLDLLGAPPTSLTIAPRKLGCSAYSLPRPQTTTLAQQR